METKTKTPLDRAALWQKYHHWLYALILPVYLILFFWQESVLDGSGGYISVYMPLDDLIPFCEWFYLPYVVWYPFMGVMGLYLGFKAPADFKRYMTYIGVSFLTALLLFALFPTGQDLRPDIDALGRDNPLTRAIAALYRTDTNTNVCPSLHVVGSMAVVFGVFHNERLRRTVWCPIVSIVIALLIILSTMFIKQHSAVDVLVGLPYGFLTYAIVYHLPGVIRRLQKRKAPAITG